MLIPCVLRHLVSLYLLRHFIRAQYLSKFPQAAYPKYYLQFLCD